MIHPKIGRLGSPALRAILVGGGLTLIQPYYQPINMAAESLRGGLFSETRLKNHRSFDFPKLGGPANFCSRAYGASQESLDNNRRKFYKELGAFSLKKRIENSVLHAEMLGPTAALELEEAQHCNQEIIGDYDLWEDIGARVLVATWHLVIGGQNPCVERTDFVRALYHF